MDAVEKMVQDILKEAKEKADELIFSEKKKLQESSEEALKNLVLQYQKEEEKVLEQKKNTLAMKRRHQENALRSNVLAKKQQLLHEIFKQALEEVERLSTLEFDQFLKTSLQLLPKKEKGILLIGEKSQPFFQKSLLEAFPNIEQSSETIPNKSGFIVDFQGIEYNFTLESLVQQVRDEKQASIQKKIWG